MPGRSSARSTSAPGDAAPFLPPRPPLAALEEASSPAKPSRAGRRLVLRPGLAAGLAALLIAVGVGAGALLSGGSDGDESGEPAIALSPVDDGKPGESGTVRVDDGGRKVKIAVDGLPPSGDDEFYEAWLLSATNEVVSLGGFRVGEDGSGELEAQLPDDPSRYRYFDVSVEKADGDAAHSGRSVLRAGTSPS